MINFIKKYKDWFYLMFGAILCVISIRVFVGSALLFYGHEDLLAGIIGLWFAKFFWNKAYDIQDNFHYKRYVEKTGDDFEERYLDKRGRW